METVKLQTLYHYKVGSSVCNSVISVQKRFKDNDTDQDQHHNFEEVGEIQYPVGTVKHTLSLQLH